MNSDTRRNGGHSVLRSPAYAPAGPEEGSRSAEEIWQFLQFGEKDAERLSLMKNILEECIPELNEGLYGHFLSFEETRRFFEDQKVLERAKRTQRTYLQELMSGEYGPEYISNRISIGMVHERINLPVDLYIGAYSHLLGAIAERLREKLRDDPGRAFGYILSLTKLIFMDIALAMDTYIDMREQTIRSQQHEIRELSNPVLVFRGRLIVPIVGQVDSRRSLQLTESLLHAIRAHRVRVVIMDVTGVPTIDSGVANHFIQTIQASKLLGATVILTGVSPENAKTLTRLAVDPLLLNTKGDLENGMDEADRLLEAGRGTPKPAPAGHRDGEYAR